MKTKLEPGRFVRIWWKDVPEEDGLFLGKNGRGYQVLCFTDWGIASVERSQIVKVGSRVRIPKDLIAK